MWIFFEVTRSFLEYIYEQISQPEAQKVRGRTLAGFRIQESEQLHYVKGEEVSS